MSLELLVTNLTGNSRRETLDGKEYLVVPLSMLVPGVLNGSKGPLFYPPDETSREVLQWNNMPIVVNHPVDDSGNPVSARFPQVLRKYQVGSVFNSSFVEKLDAEGWFDIEKSRQLIPNEFNKIENGKPVELSTGLFTDNQPVKNKEDAVYNGKQYTYIARNYRPDHLAVLTNGKKGACSIKDGCGVNVNEGPNGGCGDGKWGDGGGSGRSQGYQEATANDLTPYKIDWDLVENKSLSDLASSVRQALQDRFGDECYVEDIFPFDSYVIFRKNYGPGEGKLMQLSYTLDKKSYKVTLSDEAPSEVRRITDYKSVTNREEDSSTSSHPDDNHVHSLDQGKLVDTSIRNESSEPQWYELVNNQEYWSQLVPNVSTLPKISPQKARKILKDGTIRGESLSDEQKKLFGAIASKSTNNSTKENDMPLTAEQKTDIINNLISEGLPDSVTAVWNEDDRQALEKLPDEKLVAMNEQRELVIGAMHKDDEYDDEGKKKKKPAMNQETQETPQPPLPQVNEREVVQNWLKGAGVDATPEEAGSAFRNAINFERQRKKDLVSRIVANEGNDFSEDELKGMSLEYLTKLSKLVGNKEEEEKPTGRFSDLVPHYMGVAGPKPTTNVKPPSVEDDLEMVPQPIDYSS